ncbi:GntR family transcriptional regulator [Rothia amarae]|uniref:GntR family transcriptional regulator n=1 Tax=Rothia amarae TaxID=169480 RepID=A0A7H2BIM9_9MICC|nr:MULTISPECIES: GntR family transcriptional regulator [Rothia]QNV39525.1 GntR family transcriptional regulator [Rothia amarae]
MTSVNPPKSAESSSVSRSFSGARLPEGSSPKYHRLASFLSTSFVKDAPAHTPLPTERELQEYFGVSRDTVRRAISSLQRQGLVYNVQGSGSYVAEENRRIKEPHLVSYTDDMVARGFTPSTITMGFKHLEANDSLANLLGVTAGTPIIEAVRLRRANGDPMCFEKARFLSEVFKNSTPELNVPLERQLAQNGYRIERVKEKVSAVSLDYEESAALSVPLHTAGLRIDRIGYTNRGKPIESTVAVYRADRYDFEFDLYR